ncbi:hypothetical protein STEG23_001327, partial [Scotinomys teguina]
SDMNPVPLGSRMPHRPSLAAIPVLPKDRQTARTPRRRKQLATDQQQMLRSSRSCPTCPIS